MVAPLYGTDDRCPAALTSAPRNCALEPNQIIQRFGSYGRTSRRVRRRTVIGAFGGEARALRVLVSRGGDDLTARVLWIEARGQSVTSLRHWLRDGCPHTVFTCEYFNIIDCILTHSALHPFLYQLQSYTAGCIVYCSRVLCLLAFVRVYLLLQLG